MFSNIGTNLLLITTEGGYGVAVDHETGKRTYMKMAGAGLGIGIGAVTLVVAAVAVWIPSRRASTIDPLIAMRSE